MDRFWNLRQRAKKRLSRAFGVFCAVFDSATTRARGRSALPSAPLLHSNQHRACGLERAHEARVVVASAGERRAIRARGKRRLARRRRAGAGRASRVMTCECRIEKKGGADRGRTGAVDDAVDRGVGHAHAADDQAARLQVGGAVADPGGPLVGHRECGGRERSRRSARLGVPRRETTRKGGTLWSVIKIPRDFVPFCDSCKWGCVMS